MRVKEPLSAEDARGKFFNSAVFGKRRGTNWARGYIKTITPYTEKEATARNRIRINAYAWGDLTDEQRTAWDNYAAGIVRVDSMGQEYSLSGQQEFIATNSVLPGAWDLLIEDPPGTEIPEMPDNFTCHMMYPGGPIEFYWIPVDELYWLQFFLTERYGRGRMSGKENEYYLENYWPVVISPYTSSGCGSGKKRFWKVRPIRLNGQWGSWVYGSISE